MGTFWWWGLAAMVLLAAVPAAWLVRVRRRKPLTREQRLRAGRKAARAIRRDSPRGDRDHFGRGRGIGDTHSAAILENSVYGDAAGGGGGGGAD